MAILARLLRVPRLRASAPYRTPHPTHGRPLAQAPPQGRPPGAKLAGEGSADRAVRGSHPIERLARPAAYLMKVPPAVAGQRGHDRTFHAACILIQGFDLTIDEARPLLHQWNLGCTPPWSTAELEHKLLDALKAGDSRPRGYLWDHGFQSSGKNLRRDSGHDSNGLGSGPRPSRLGNDFPPTPPLLLYTCPDGHEANPHRLAQQFLMSTFAFAGGIGLRYWRDEFHSWDGTAYNAVPPSEMRAQATRSVADEFDRLYRISLLEKDLELPGSYPADAGGGNKGRARGLKSRAVARPIAVTGRLVSDVLQALASLVMVPSRQIPAQPAWLTAWPEGLSAPEGLPLAVEPAWPAGEILAARNALVHLPSLVQGIAHSTPPSPCFFNAYGARIWFRSRSPGTPRVAGLSRADLGARYRKHFGSPRMVRLSANPRYAAAKDFDDGWPQTFRARNDRPGAEGACGVKHSGQPHAFDPGPAVWPVDVHR